MMNGSSISAVRVLLWLARQERRACWSPRRLAEVLGESPSYLAKVLRRLVRQGILEVERGVRGGVRLVRDPEEITLLAVVEACQGKIIGNYCRSARPDRDLCSFHRAARELHEAVCGVLGRWTIARLLQKPQASGSADTGIPCLMAEGRLLRVHGGAAGRSGRVRGVSGS